jgi:hypothetical protein
VGNWLYTYPSQSQARQAAALITEEMRAENAKFIGEGNSLSKNVKGQIFHANGDIGDSVYWFVGVDDNTLYLVLANGLNQDSVAKVFTQALQMSFSSQ